MNNADKIVKVLMTGIAIVAVIKFLDHPSSRNLRTAVIDLFSIS